MNRETEFEDEIDDHKWYVWDVESVQPCKDCLAMHGVVFKGDDIPLEPLHPNCRCGFYEMDRDTVAELVLSGDIVIENGVMRFKIPAPSIDAPAPTFGETVNDRPSEYAIEKRNPINNIVNKVVDVIKKIFPWS